MSGTNNLLGLPPHGPHMPVAGIGLIIALLEVRNLSKLIYSIFNGCKSIWDVVSRLVNMDDAHFIDVTLAMLMICVMVWAILASFRGGMTRKEPPDDDAL